MKLRNFFSGTLPFWFFFWIFFGALPAAVPDSALADSAPFKRHTYRPASPDRRLAFPRDHGAHPDSSYEWWYFTGHVAPVASPGKAQDAQPEIAGFELTVFRISPLAQPDRPSYFVAHLAWSDLQTRKFRHLSFGSPEKAGVAEASQDHLKITMPGIRVVLTSPSEISLDIDVLWEGIPFQLKSELKSHKPVTLHGENGYSKKAECTECASHYTSFTRLQGPLALKTEKLWAQVWFDHEFGSNSLGQSISGWDWFALQLTDGWDLMIYQLHDSQGKPAHRSGTWVDPAGKTYALEEKQITLSPVSQWTSPHTDAHYPASWKLSIDHPARSLKADLLPKLSDQEISSRGLGLATYWEGTCEVKSPPTPTQAAHKLGDAYLEMTGYDLKRPPRF
ncbi:MAG: hypothetical protein H7222_03880 [Methylotenera sp.]|nr:hypothetical protein [Oligoflexia bacterium]